MKVKKYINGERRLVEPSEKYYSKGPAPRTARGKRRHAKRNPQQAAHAKAVWKSIYYP